jgi:hypothetical protein
VQGSGLNATWADVDAMTGSEIVAVREHIAEARRAEAEAMRAGRQRRK